MERLVGGSVRSMASPAGRRRGYPHKLVFQVATAPIDVIVRLFVPLGRLVHTGW